uniref:Uncharacterized protein n=1 Tax=Trypanosoma congolense (strain IL3000) TaxID=1068625 RepID=G0UNR1_TRYCI|nr:hypothetical protein, unlikely [Trypanosoma congolense IL3000]
MIMAQRYVSKKAVTEFVLTTTVRQKRKYQEVKIQIKKTILKEVREYKTLFESTVLFLTFLTERDGEEGETRYKTIYMACGERELKGQGGGRKRSKEFFLSFF